MNSAAVPMATPPARVAFWICTCQVKQHVSYVEIDKRYMTSRKSDVFQSEHHHVQLSFLLRHAGDGHGGENRGSKSKVSVDGRSVLSVAVVGDGRVETGPEHPEEQCTCEVR